MSPNIPQEENQPHRHHRLLIILRNRQRQVPETNDQDTTPGLMLVQRRSGGVRKKRFDMNTMLKRLMNIVSRSPALRQVRT
jgi:hypothetical protein